MGDTKYYLFRNITFLCLGCWLVLGMPGRICAVVRNLRMPGNERRSALARSFSSMDFAVAAYGMCVILSALCSSYGRLAWIGYEGWFMGAVSQVLFVGIYFFVSRQYDGSVWPLYLGELAFLIVTMLGLLHRLGIDPLELHKWWNSSDWEYSHMLSTLGNINWLCGLYSVVLALPVMHFLREERLWMQIFSYIVTVTAFVLLGIQGSQGGLLILGVCAVLCIFLGRNRPAVMRKVFLLWTGFFLCVLLMEQLVKMRGEKAAMTADGNIFAVTEWYFWVGGAVLCVVLRHYSIRKKDVVASAAIRGSQSCRLKSKTQELQSPKHESKRRIQELQSDKHRFWRGRHRVFIAVLALGILAAGIVAVFLLFLGSVEDSFGSGRGLLWRIAVESFGQADWKGKLIGAGPDCYAEAVFNRLGWASDVWAGEHWEFAVFTNAHNEILNQLCNTGILGTLSYLAIFLTGICRYGRCAGAVRPEGSPKSNSEGWRESSLPSSSRSSFGLDDRRESSSESRRKDSSEVGYISGTWVGVLALAMYGIHSLISFQQVLNAPLLFLVLGLCEHEMRMRSGWVLAETGVKASMVKYY